MRVHTTCVHFPELVAKAVDQAMATCAVQDDGTLVLLDWGQCKALSLERHVALCHLIRALDVGNADSIVAAMSAMGLSFKARDGGMADPQFIKVVAYIMFDTRHETCAMRCPLSCSEPKHV